MPNPRAGLRQHRIISPRARLGGKTPRARRRPFQPRGGGRGARGTAWASAPAVAAGPGRRGSKQTPPPSRLRRGSPNGLPQWLFPSSSLVAGDHGTGAAHVAALP